MANVGTNSSPLSADQVKAKVANGLTANTVTKTDGSGDIVDSSITDDGADTITVGDSTGSTVVYVDSQGSGGNTALIKLIEDGATNSGGFIEYNGNAGVNEFYIGVDDSGVVSRPFRITREAMSDDMLVLRSSAGQHNVTLNEGANDVDIVINKQTSGEALRYNAGADTFTVGSDLTLSNGVDLNLDGLNLSESSDKTLVITSTTADDARLRFVDDGTNGMLCELRGANNSLRLLNDAFGTMWVANATALDITTANCGGISFDAGDVLDSYDEGTWTPVLAGSSTAGSHTYSVQSGRYTKIGNFVAAHFYIQISSKDGTMAGDIRITGLPFTAVNDSGHRTAATFSYVQNFAFTDMIAGRVVNNVTYVRLEDITQGTGGTTGTITDADVGTSPVLQGTILYEAA